VKGRIIVHSLAEANAALAGAAALGLPVTLSSAPGAGLYAGALWFKALMEAAAAANPGVAVSCILDCGDAAGAVLAGLRTGLRHLRFTGPEATRQRLQAIAAQLGARVEGDEPVTLLDLRGQRRPEEACRKFLAASGTDS
jgi:hypothetical protein